MLRNFKPVHAVSILATLAVAAIGISVSFLLWNLHERELRHARLETESLTRMFMEQTEQGFENADLILRGIQERMQSSYGRKLALDGIPVRLLLGSRVAGMRHLRSIFIVNDKGMVVNTTRPEGLISVSVADRDYFKVFAEGRENALFIGHPVPNRSFGVWTLHLARPLLSDDGRLEGVVVAAFDVNQFEQLYSFLRLDFERPIAVYLADGTLVASVPHREGLIGSRAPELGPDAVPAVAGVIKVTPVARDGGTSQRLSVGRLVHLPLAVSVLDDESQALASWRDVALPIGVGAGLVGLFLAMVALLLVRELQREESLTKALDEANDRHHHTIDSVMDAIVAIDEWQRIVLFNPAAERMFGLPASAAIGQTMGMLVPAHLRAAHESHVAQFLAAPASQGSMARQMEIIGLRADGVNFPIESTISKTYIGGKVQMTAVLRDVTNSRRTEANLLAVNHQLRALYSSMQTVREEERTRIARELHDELGQQLTGLKLDLSWLNSRLKDGRVPTADKMDGMRHLLDDAIASVRRISSDLRPLILDDLGFGEAVTWQAQEIAKRSGLDIRLNLEAANFVTEGGVSTALFRIVQESLTNVVRHSGASRVEISLVAHDDKLVMMVTDDGKGFHGDDRQGGIGLLNMRERPMSMGGHFRIISEPGKGATIQVTIALDTALTTGE